jgi:hypothetical protein
MVTVDNRKGLRGLARDVGLLLHMAEDEYRRARCFQGYFATLASSYPLLAECPRQLLEAEARRLGIPIEGRTRLEIARAVFERVRASGSPAVVTSGSSG